MNYSVVNTIWILLGTALVFFMQAGFAMLETGMTREKNAGNIVMKNIIDFCIGTVAFWVIGFGIMYGGSGTIFGSVKGFASEAAYGNSMLPVGIPFWAFLVFETAFAGISATIVSGALAERTKFAAYCVYSIFISMLIYPISGHWIWGGGWLQQLGFHDLAGSTTVHMVGGVSAFVGASFLGPRMGKYSRNGKSKPIPGHSMQLAALGIFILWFCWFGFNGCSIYFSDGSESVSRAGKVFFNTNISAAIGGCTAMLVSWMRYKKPDISMTINGILGGLVAITAGCDTVSSYSAAIIGICAGVLVVFAIEFMENTIKVDDPVGASVVHGGCGLWGTIAVGLFSDGAATKYSGLLMGGGLRQVGIQLLGAVFVALYVALATAILFSIIRRTIGLRVSTEAEIDGLDIHEHNMIDSYAEYFSGDGVNSPIVDVPKVMEEKFDSYKDNQKENTYSMVVIVTRRSKLDALLVAMNDIGVTGVTISHVSGFGMQRGNKVSYYRSSQMELRILPKVKVEIVLGSVPVSKVIATAEKVLYTGQFGDGKIFVQDIRDVVKVRTGEEGVAALVDTEAEDTMDDAKK